MRGARTIYPILLTWLVVALAGGCTTVGPAVQTAPPTVPPSSLGAESAAPSAPAPSASVDGLPSVEPPTSVPASAAPTPSSEPVQTEAPPATQRPPKTNPPLAKANLIVSKFASPDDQLLVGTASKLNVTVKNTGGTAASRFSVGIYFAYGGQEGLVESEDVNGLGPGDTKRITVSFNPMQAVEYTLTARADIVDDVNESDESDNEKSFQIAAVSLGNLSFDPPGFVVALAPGGPKYRFTFALKNTGNGSITGPLNVKFFAYYGASDYVEWGTFATNVDLAPGDVYTDYSDFTVDPGIAYAAYAFLDSGEVFEESDETDNVKRYDFTVPAP